MNVAVTRPFIGAEKNIPAPGAHPLHGIYTTVVQPGDSGQSQALSLQAQRRPSA